MEVREEKREEEITLYVKGPIDASNSGMLQEKIMSAVQKCENIRVDLAGVDYMSNEGLRALFIGKKLAMGHGGDLVLLHVCPYVREALYLSGMDRFISIVEQ